MNATSPLTPRQQQILDLVCEGLRNTEIASQLHLSLATVKEHRSALMRKLNVANVVELVQWANQQHDSRKPALDLSENPRLLVVEDEPITRELLVTSLLSMGFPCRAAASAAEVEAILAESPADVVILDLNLDGEDGLNIAESLRQRHRCGIIMTTTRSQLQQRLEGLVAGADAYLVKPVDMRELLGIIRNLHRRCVGV